MSRRPGRPSRFWESVAVVIVKPLSGLLVRHDWRRADRVPRTGGVIIVTNHLSLTDPVLLGHYLWAAGRWPVVLAKSGLFGVPVLGKVLVALRAIPVYRGRSDASNSLTDAEERLAEGGCILFYPEGTVTRDPDFWPMAGKTGAARLALATGAPVIPVAHWGAQELLPYGQKKPRLFPRKTFTVIAGEPVDLSGFADRPAEATAEIMRAVTALLAELRGVKTPDI
ncbi:lysophospholipid acyltransferase family protein [Herbidospora sp. RD11066]